MSDPDFEPELLIDFETSIDLIRIMDSMMTPVRLLIRAAVLPGVDGEETGSDEDIAVAFAKIRYWLEHVMARSVVFAVGNETAGAMLFDDSGRVHCANPIMLTPEAPTDEHLAVLLQAKLSALSVGAVRFGAIRLQSYEATGLLYTFLGDARELLPDPKDWLGERNYFDKPWWERDTPPASIPRRRPTPI